MIAGLTACGKGNGGNGNGGSSVADSSLAKQYVFKEQALDLNMDSDNMNIDLLTRKGDTVYLLFETYEYFENGNQSKLHLMTMKPDGTVIDTVELPMWKEGEAPATPAPAQDGENPVDTPADGADGSGSSDRLQDEKHSTHGYCGSGYGCGRCTGREQQLYIHIAQQLYGRFGWECLEYAILSELFPRY